VRMRACGVHSYDDYRALLDQSPAELERLRDALTINVTRFYRNAETWNLIRRDLLPAMLDARRPEIRMWSAGCASGEEPYTLAVLAADHLDRAGCGEGLARLTIDATDIDRGSLERARAACYRSEGLTELPDDLAGPYFEANSNGRRVVDRVRRRVQVHQLDLSREPPLRNDYDLILCRNVVIYFDRPMQERVFRSFADALVPGGYLVLGKVETLFGTARERLTLVDPRERVYRRPA
jgi:chemotaxis protein methyltransferase CheR